MRSTFLLIFALLLQGACAERAGSASLFVDGRPMGGVVNQRTGQGYTSLQEAVAQAAAYDTLWLHPGKHALQRSKQHASSLLTIAVRGLCLMGIGSRDSVVLCEAQPPEHAPVASLLTVSASDVLLQNMTLMPSHCTQAGIEVQGDNLLMRYCKVQPVALPQGCLGMGTVMNIGPQHGVDLLQEEHGKKATLEHCLLERTAITCGYQLLCTHCEFDTGVRWPHWTMGYCVLARNLAVLDHCEFVNLQELRGGLACYAVGLQIANTQAQLKMQGCLFPAGMHCWGE